MSTQYHVRIRIPDSSVPAIFAVGLEFEEGYPSNTKLPVLEELETPGVDGRAYREIYRQFPRMRFKTRAPYPSDVAAGQAMDRFKEYVGPRVEVSFRIGTRTLTLMGVIRETSELRLEGRLAGFGAPANNVVSIAYTIVFDRV